MRRIAAALGLVLVVLAAGAALLSRGDPAGPATPAPTKKADADAARPGAEAEPPGGAAIDPRRTGRLKVRVGSGDGPVAGARIEVRPARGRPLRLRADAEGIARHESVPEGWADLEVRADGLSSRTGRALVPIGGFASREIHLWRPRTLAGTVVTTDGAPVPGGRVRLFETAGVYIDGKAWESLDTPIGEARTGADGHFRAEGLPGSFRDSALFLASAEGLRTALFYGKSGIRIALAPGSPLEGRVADGEGRPVAGARVVAVPASHPNLWREDGGWRRSIRDRVEEAVFAIPTRTGADGRYRLEGLGRGETYVVRFFADGFSFREFRGVRPGEGPLDATLVPGGSVRATVKDEAGNPIAGARVRLGGPWDRWFPRAETDAAGRARIGPVPPGGLSVRASAEGYANANARTELTAGSDAEVEIVLARDPARPAKSSRPPPVGDETLTGTVLFSDGEPVSRGCVTVRPPCRRTEIEPGGRFRIDFLPRGEVELTIDPYQGEDTKIRAAVPGPDLEIVVPRMRGVRGRLVLPAGAIAPETVAVRSGRWSTNLHWPRDGGDACPFHLPFEAGVRSVEFRAGGFLPLVWKGEVPESGAVPAGDLALDPGSALTGRVVTEAGDPIPGAEVGVGTPGRASYRVRTGAAGEFRLTGFGHESTSIYAVADGYLGVTRSVYDNTGEVELVLPRGVRVEVTVVTMDGDPIPGATVELRLLAAGSRTRSARTEADGGAAFRVVPGSCKATAIVGDRSATELLELDGSRPLERVVLVPR